MKLEDFLKNTHKIQITKLPKGEAYSPTEVYEMIIKKKLPKEETIKKWHNLLLDYIEQKDAVFFIRRYGSASNKQWDLIRRGFLTEYPSGLKYVFCDNFFAHYFYLMALENFIPTLEEFNKLIKSRKFPYGYMKTSKEEPFQAYPKGKMVGFNNSGWKLAHIYSVNKNDYSFNYRQECDKLFPRGKQTDWIIQKGNDYPLRYIENEDKNLREVAIAHFLRLVHPINYFLVPQAKNSNIDIGENPYMISFMRKLNYERFGDLFLKYEELIMSKNPAKYEDLVTGFHFKYGLEYKKLNSKIDEETILNSEVENLNVKHNISDINLSVIKAYVIDGLSFRSIEREILNIDSKVRGGGFVAKNLINSYGVEATDKGTITKENIENMISNSKGKLKDTLIELQKFIIRYDL